MSTKSGKDQSNLKADGDRFLIKNRLLIPNDNNEFDSIMVYENMIGSYAGMDKYGWDHLNECPIYAPENNMPIKLFNRHFNQKNKVEFESILAVKALENARLFLPTLHKIGRKMASFLESYLVHQTNCIEFKRKLGQIYNEFLFTDKTFFGRLGTANEAFKDTADAFDCAISILKMGIKIENILFIHMATIKIYKDLLEGKNDQYFNKLYELISPPSIFINRGRKKLSKEEEQEYIGKNSTAISHPGIEEIPSINTIYPITLHTRAVDRFIRSVEDVPDFTFNAYSKDIPFVAGISGSTASCLLSVTTLGNANLTLEEFKEYAFCCMGYLISAGAHSFHEIYSVANRIGIPYIEGRYEAPIPLIFKNTTDYQILLAKHSNMIIKIEERTASLHPLVTQFDLQPKLIK